MLLDLTEEILLAVIVHLDTRSLKQFALVKKGLQRLVEPQFFRHVTLSGNRFYHSVPAPLNIFLQTLLSFPQHGKLIRTLHFIGDPWDSSLLPTRQEVALVLEGLAGTGYPLNAQINEELVWGIDKKGGEYRILEVCVAILLHCSPNVEAVYHGSHFGCELERLHDVSFIGDIFKHHLTPGIPSCHFLALREFDYASEVTPLHENRCKHFEDLLWLFYLPKIEYIKFSLCRVFDPDSTIQWPLHVPRPPRLHTFILQHSDIQVELIDGLLSVAPDLKRLDFHFRAMFEFDFTNPHHLLDCCKLSDILQVRAGSLEYLALSITFVNRLNEYDDWFAWINLTQSVHGSLRRLKSLTQLKFLRAPITMLLGYPGNPSGYFRQDIPELPPHLEVFCCTDDRYDPRFFHLDKEAVATVIEASLRSHRRSLKSFIAGTAGEFGHYEMWTPNSLSRIHKVCEELDITFSLVEFGGPLPLDRDPGYTYVHP
ncbi:MAG: hypothetical protein LQ341_002383 [Variospora aurantia]|nr:MAG: hypothetical protein LQ341_002383 [Variospora aurantia]